VVEEEVVGGAAEVNETLCIGLYGILIYMLSVHICIACGNVETEQIFGVIYPGSTSFLVWFCFE
jgi:hypothetical protein